MDWHHRFEDKLDGVLKAVTKVNTEVALLTQREDASTKALTETCERLDRNFSKLNEVIIGNGRVGHATRLDRLEQMAKKLQWFVGGICVGITGLILERIGNLF